MNPTLRDVTERIVKRSAESRKVYLEKVARAQTGKRRRNLSCGNLAHGIAACDAEGKHKLSDEAGIDVAIVSAYNDMLSAHHPYKDYPDIIKAAASEKGAIAQFAGGVPAMCDGVTQGQPGMELSLFSRDVIAMATAVALSHDMFNAVLCLGICDKIVPGLLTGALCFGHLPTIFVPGGPMTSGIPNDEKSRIRQLFAQGQVDRQELLKAEMASYHAAGTCTFYGTANSNQMFMEIMGLHMPGAAFVNPEMPLRHALTVAAAQHAVDIAIGGKTPRPIADVIDERSFVNAVVGLMATGGSTNHTIHLIACARAAGIILNWQDFADISRITPLLARIYPNGSADVNQFQAAGGVGFVIAQLLKAGLLHEDVQTIMGQGLSRYTEEPFLDGGRLIWRPGTVESLDTSILRPIDNPFADEGGIRLMTGNLGRSVMKISAVKPQHRRVIAPAAVFDDQDDVIQAFKDGKLNRDVVVVLRGQGPSGNGMPELHKLTPSLGVLLDLGYKVALVTDGRMSGASGKVPAAIHLTPEASHGGPLARLQDGDIVELDAETGRLDVQVEDAKLAARELWHSHAMQDGIGRELFAGMRQLATTAEQGAMTFGAWIDSQGTKLGGAQRVGAEVA
ncbi:phosphogluconate dehydratase [Dongia soli]|uniref:Phosphogluconate dehydratase n=1 Tax=Dongia soli TaxID=600628 RepID=A0ABU5EAA6_9PROT|nr:phosphogluconate dehydratase [Dongia soli]MDY0883276.1 phosphogluconate dehydratase [Dongia soli]